MQFLSVLEQYFPEKGFGVPQGTRGAERSSASPLQGQRQRGGSSDGSSGEKSTASLRREHRARLGWGVLPRLVPTGCYEQFFVSSSLQKPTNPQYFWAILAKRLQIARQLPAYAPSKEETGIGAGVMGVPGGGSRSGAFLERAGTAWEFAAPNPEGVA